MGSGLLKTCRSLSAYALLGGGLFVVAFFSATAPARAATGINQQINFQGRLLNAQGAVVPDGYYNIEFNIYQDGDGQETGDTGGSLMWTEDYLDNNADAGVEVQNGYLSVQLGSICPFTGGSCQGRTNTAIDWNQDTLWLSMNVAGDNNTCTTFDSGSCTADGEMTPMKRLSSSVYAMDSLNSDMLGGLSSAQYVQLGQSLQTDASTNASIAINKTNTGDLLDLQSSGADVFTLNGTGDATFGANANHTLSVATAAASTAGSALTISSGAAGTGASALAGGNLTIDAGAGGGTNGKGGDLILDAGAPNGSGSSGNITIGANHAPTITIGSSSAGAILAHSSSTITLESATGIALSGNTTASAQLNVSGSLATQKGTDFSTTGVSNDVSFGNVSLVRLTGASAQTIDGIANGRDGYILTIVNAGTTAATIANQSGTDGTPANRIITSTGADLSLAVDSSVEMIYDASTSRWRVVSVSAGTGSYIQNQNASVQSANFRISNTGEADTSLLTPLLDSTGTNLNIGATSGGHATAVNLNQDVTVASGKNLTLTSGNATLSSGNLTLTSGNATLSSGNLTLTSGTYSQTWSIAAGGGNAATYAVTDNNASGSNTVAAEAVNLTGHATAGTNNISGTSFGNVTPIANNNFYALNFGTGYTDLLRYNGQQLISGAGLLQNVAIDPTLTYSNLEKVGALTVGSIGTGFGAISTGNAITTTGTVTGGIVNATTTLELGGADINTGGTLSDVAYLDHANTFTATNLIETTSPTAFEVENAGGATKVLDVDTTDGRVGIGTATPIGLLNVEQSTYSSNLAVISDGTTGTPPTYPSSFAPAFVVQTSETTGSRPLFFGYKNGTGWDGFLTSGACGSFTQMCLDLGTGTTAYTGLENIGTTLNIGGGSDGNFTNVAFNNSGSVILGGNGTITTPGANVITINPGGAAGINLGTANATLVKIGNATANFSVTSTGFNVDTSGNITTPGTYNTNTFTSSALQFAGGNPVISSTGTNSLTLDTGGAGELDVAVTHATTVKVGNTGATTSIEGATLNLGNGTTAHTINIGHGGSVAQIVNIGSSSSTSSVAIQGGSGTSVSLQSQGGIAIGNNAVAQTIGIGNTTSGTSITLTAGASNEVINNTSDTVKTAALQVQNTAGSSTVLSINTATPTVTINSNVTGTSGLQFSQLNSSSSTNSSFSQLLGVDSSGNVGLSSAGVSLTSPALAYWDGLNNPTTGSQAYPTATLSGNATYAGGGNGIELTTAANYQNGSINWSFSQVPFEESQFQFKAGTGAADSTWFYGYADSTPTTEYGCNAVPNSSCSGTTGPFMTSGYLVYFSEYHNCIGIAWGHYNDGNQCGSGGGTNPLTSVSVNNSGSNFPNIKINDNNWHQVDIQILDNVITVRWDGQVIINYTDVYTRDTSHLNYGFGSRTGGSNNTHYIKGLLVTKLGSNVSEFNINDISPMTNDLQNSNYNMYWQNSTGDLGINTYTPNANLDVNGTTDLEGNVTLGSLGSGGTTSLCLNGSNVISSCSGGGGASGTIVDQRTSTGTHTYTEGAAAGYYLSDTVGNTTTDVTFNITGLSNTEGTTAYVASYLDKTTGTSRTVEVTIDFNGQEVADTTTAATGQVNKNFIVMYINGSWRVIGYGNTSSASTSDTADYAEWIDYSGDAAPQPGDVLTVGSGDSTVADSTSPYDSHLMGVVSTSPYQVGGKDDGHSVVLALTGRAPVKVSLENGPIKAGDPLTSSSTPGVAMKATKPGDIIGTALSGYDGSQDTNEVTVQLHVGYDDPTAGSSDNSSPKLDSSATAPTATSDESLLGSMYYDTTLGSIQCYEASGWGSCSSSPDTIETLSPEYVNSVSHGTGVGSMTSDFCSQALHINDGSSGQPTVCNANETFNFYKWTSPQATDQAYHIYVTYQLPTTFKNFGAGQTSLMARTDSDNSTVKYSIYRENTSTALTKCGSTVTASTGAVSDWQPAPAVGAADPATCGFSPGDQILFDIEVHASKNANAYVGNINFTFNNK